MTCTLPELPTIFAMRANPASACSFNFFVMVVCLPVYSTSICSPRPCNDRRRLAYTTLVRTWNLHVFPILRHRSSGYLDSLPLELGCQLIVRQRLPFVLFLNQLLHLALQQHQRQISALRPVHSLGEEEAQLKDSLRRVHILIRNRAAYGRRMHADLLG